jgi:hypothetical protein
MSGDGFPFFIQKIYVSAVQQLYSRQTYCDKYGSVPLPAEYARLQKEVEGLPAPTGHLYPHTLRWRKCKKVLKIFMPG